MLNVYIRLITEFGRTNFIDCPRGGAGVTQGFDERRVVSFQCALCIEWLVFSLNRRCRERKGGFAKRSLHLGEKRLEFCGIFWHHFTR